ncbi:hypothetical protein JTB14_017368 [Gonioctena quinquepunctata]|nr:hypothetical protein JTB14_017368 [Gonioctena quinquepunctata]
MIHTVRTIYLDYPTPIKALDYSYYPYSYRTYRPLTLYYDYYWPLSSLNRYYWPRYPYYNRYRYYKYTLPSDRYYYLKGIFDDETRLIRAQTASLLKRIHNPVPRVQRYSWPLSVTPKYIDNGVPARLSNDNYIHRLLITSSRNPKVEYTTYYSEPIRKYIGQSHLSCVSYAGDRAYNRRPHIYLYENPLRNDIQLLSYYINKFKDEKAIAASESIKADKVEEKPEITEITE